MQIKNLKVNKDGNPILKGLNAEFESGKIHIIMGPNGSGKSTLSNTIAGHPDCDVIEGHIFYKNNDLLQEKIEDRALNGIYLSPQYPPVIEGLSHAAFFKEILNIRNQAKNLEPVDDFQFLKILRDKATEYQFDPKTYPKQSFNSGFSGGEKKRNEILQISLLEPDFVILDEIDSGLDIESMKNIASFILNYKTLERTILVITHYPQFAELIEADYVHILKNGQLVHSGDKSLIQNVVNNGFGEF
jgi:Fe-S cluster assembly ATP-binding protein